MAQIHALTPEGRLPTAAVEHVQEIVVPRTTGWRDVTAWVQNRVSGRILLRRDEKVLVFVLDELVLSVSGSVTVNRLPSGLRPLYRVRGDWFPSLITGGGSVNISGGGYCHIYDVVADQAMSARIVGDFADGYHFPSPYPGDPA